MLARIVMGCGPYGPCASPAARLTSLRASFALCLATTSVTYGASTPLSDAQSPVIVTASSVGAHLDSDLLKGGGTDDTAVLQAVLNRAANGRPLHLIIDGSALMSGLDIYGNTTLECLNGAGLYLKDGSRRAILRNKHRSRDAVLDQRITVRGCFLNGNRKSQPSADILRPDRPEDLQRLFPEPSNKEPDGTYMAGLQFLGVNDLTLEHVTLWATRAFGALIANGERITIRNVTVDHGGGDQVRDYFVTDGFHFKGPLRYVTLDNIRVHVGDDALAFNADDYDTDDLARRNYFGPYVRSGPITDVTVNDLQFMDTLCGIRILSAHQRVDRITIANVQGTVRGFHVLQISHWMNLRQLGNVGSVLVSNINVDRSRLPEAPKNSKNDQVSATLRRRYEAIMNAHPDYKRTDEEESNRGVSPFININAHVEHLVLKNVMTHVTDDRPILRLGPAARVQMLEADVHLFDPQRQAVPVKLDDGAHIDDFTLALNWPRGQAGKQDRVITYPRASIGRLNVRD